jgi:hypothetical protein
MNLIDRLADLLKTIRILRTEVRAIRAQILSGEVPRIGDKHEVRVHPHVTIREREGE